MQTSPPLSNPFTVPSLGVIIPTYNRSDHLLLCLRHLETQTSRDFEVVVVDDGSSDATEDTVKAFLPTASFRLRYLRQANGGPASARNRAIDLLRTPICVMIGDDTFPEPGFIATHLEFHKVHPESEAAAVGLTVWSEEGQVVTRLMRWLESDGVQFGYRSLLAGETPDWRYFYTSNLSIKTSLLGRSPFHEDFRAAGMEDIELGYRLTREHNLRMFFLPGAIARHLHPTTFSKTCRRAEVAGEASFQFAQLWPEQRRGRPGGFKGFVLKIAAERRVVLPIFTLAARLLTVAWCPNPLLARVVQLHEIVGYEREAARNSRTPS
jgi:glycosyltransferase involved in cell wall biosynthesis